VLQQQLGHAQGLDADETARPSPWATAAGVAQVLQRWLEPR
jgi:hypothetical protein